MIKIRVDGKVVTCPAIKGTDGKTAYEYATEAGYQGTEQEFTNDLVNNSNTIATHLTDENAHNDIRESIASLEEKVDNIEISGGGGTVDLTEHNADASAHSDIRQSITSLDGKVDTNIGQALVDAKAYTDTTTAQVLVDAKAYTDSAIEAAITSAIAASY